MQPVPGFGVSTPYGKRGPYWSCSEDASGNGIHTGADMAAPTGTKVVAARPGTATHVYYGSAFGSHQLAVRCSDGTEDFYAHMCQRIANGTKVDAGQKIGEVGAEGNVTGAHLHFERHKYPGWSCSIVVDPAPSINYQPAGGSGGGAVGEPEMEQSDSITKWSPDDGGSGETTVGKTLNQARGYSQDAYQRVKKLEQDVADLRKQVDKILNAVT